MKDLLSGFITNWELFIGFVLVFIMLAGEKGIWGTLEPILRRPFSPATENHGLWPWMKTSRFHREMSPR